jgi:two-component system nitrogen regulation response regulator GlnG
VGRDDPSKPAAATLTGLDTETLPPLQRVGVGGDPLVVGLTVLCHPDPDRIGEQARLEPLAQGRPVVLSRTEPDFRQPGGRARPLGDPYVSRARLVLEWSGGELVIGGEVERHALEIDGVAAAEPAVRIDERALEPGVVVTLAGRVALLLHLLGMPRAPGPDLGLIGRSESIEKVRAQVLRVAATDVPVLLRGESGTGKELVARAIHGSSGRREGPFVAVNMAAIPASTAASGLFGHVKGAFTGATAPSTGYFGQADGGTLFLDEIGDTPLEIQALLLRALESGEVQPVGASAVHRVDVRVLAATEADLEAAATAGRFRPAFLHRLAGYEILVPPLRQRRDDVARLLVSFLREELEATGQRHKLAPPPDRGAPPPLEASLVARLALHPWPGNVRQLRNVARHLAIGSQELVVLRADEEVERLLAADDGRAPSSEPDAQLQRPGRRRASPREVSGIGDQELLDSLRATGFRPGPAADRLGIGRTTIYKLMEQCPAIRTAADITDAELRSCRDESGGDVDEMARRLEVSTRALKLRLRRLRG